MTWDPPVQIWSRTKPCVKCYKIRPTNVVGECEECHSHWRVQRALQLSLNVLQNLDLTIPERNDPMSEEKNAVKELANNMLGLLTSELKELGAEAGTSLEETAAYAAARAEALAELQDQAGFSRALKAATNATMLYGAIKTVEIGDAADAKIRGMLTGALGMGAGMLKKLIL